MSYSPPPLAPDLRRLKRVLIVKLSSIGDVVHALPVSAALGEAFPHLKLTWIVDQRSAPMVLGNPYLHEVIVLPAGFYQPSVSRFVGLMRNLRARRFDLVIDLHGLFRSGVIAWCSGAHYRFGWEYLREGSSLLVTRVRRRPESLHVVDMLLDVARFLGAPIPEVKFPLYISPEDDASALKLLHSAGISPGQPFLAINPTEGGYGHKGFGAERLVGMLDILAVDCRYPVVLVGGREDRTIGKSIQAYARSRPASMVGRTNLKQLAAILRRSALHVAGDTGSAHIAAALGTPVVSIFGRSNPDRLAPYGQAKYLVHHRDQCAPVCRRVHDKAPTQFDQFCYAPPPACLAAITAQEVAAVVRQCLQETATNYPVKNSRAG